VVDLVVVVAAQVPMALLLGKGLEVQPVRMNLGRPEAVQAAPVRCPVGQVAAQGD